MNSRLSDKKLLIKIFSHWLKNDLDIKFHVVFSLLIDNKSVDEVQGMLNRFMPNLYEFTKYKAGDNRFLLRKLIITLTAILIISNEKLADSNSLKEWQRKFSCLDISRAETDNAFRGLRGWQYWVGKDRDKLSRYEKDLLQEYKVTEADKMTYTSLIDFAIHLDVLEHFDKLHNLYLLFGEGIKNLLNGIIQDRESLVDFFVKFHPLKAAFFQPFLKQLLDKENPEQRLEFLLYISSSLKTFGRLMKPISEYNSLYEASCYDKFSEIKAMVNSDCSADEVREFINQQLKDAYSYVLRFSGWRKDSADLKLSSEERVAIEVSRNDARKLCVGSAIATFFNNGPREMGIEIAEYLDPGKNSGIFLVNREANNAANKTLNETPPGFSAFCKIA